MLGSEADRDVDVDGERRWAADAVEDEDEPAAPGVEAGAEEDEVKDEEEAGELEEEPEAVDDDMVTRDAM